MNRQPRWQVVLYGRTRRADRWWRVKPVDMDVRWLNDLVVAGTGGGDGLADRPRFLLARRGDVVLVGAAGRAALLSATMNSDGSRPFYCFVGWVSQDRGAAAPALETLEAQWTSWATAVYEAWMPLDWDKHPTDLTIAHEPPFGSAPWTHEMEPGLAAAVTGAVDPRQVAPVSHPGGHLTIIPADARARVWSDLMASPGDFAIAACFDRASPDSTGVLTHVAVTGTDQARPPDPEDGTAGPGVPPVEPPLLAAPPPPAQTPPDRSLPESAPEEPHRGGMLGKASRALKSLVGAEELHPEPPVVGHGPAKDLEYWRRTQAYDPAPENRPEEKPGEG